MRSGVSVARRPSLTAALLVVVAGRLPDLGVRDALAVVVVLELAGRALLARRRSREAIPSALAPRLRLVCQIPAAAVLGHALAVVFAQDLAGPPRHAAGGAGVADACGSARGGVERDDVRPRAIRASGGWRCTLSVGRRPSLTAALLVVVPGGVALLGLRDALAVVVVLVLRRRRRRRRRRRGQTEVRWR